MVLSRAVKRGDTTFELAEAAKACLPTGAVGQGRKSVFSERFPEIAK